MNYKGSTNMPRCWVAWRHVSLSFIAGLWLRMKTSRRWLMVTYVLLGQMRDLGTTTVALLKNYQESNPLVSWLPLWGIVLVKLIGMGIISWFVYSSRNI